MKVLDSNIIVYLSKELIKIDDILEDYESCAISTITYMEVLGYDFDSKKEEDFICSFLEQFEIIYVDKSVVDEVIRLRKKYKVKLPDAIICASTIVNNATLITNDVRLKSIKELSVKSIKIK